MEVPSGVADWGHALKIVAIAAIMAWGPSFLAGCPLIASPLVALAPHWCRQKNRAYLARRCYDEQLSRLVCTALEALPNSCVAGRLLAISPRCASC